VLPLHVLSGTISLMACLIIGRRVEKFGDQYRQPIIGHSLSLAYIGGMMIFLGMIGKTVGLTAGTENVTVGTVVVNCVLSASGSGIVSGILYHISSRRLSGYDISDTSHIPVKISNRRWSLFCTLNGCLAGLVGIQAGVGSYLPWAAWVVGLIAGFIYFIVSFLLQHSRLDDGISAVAVHLGAGIWGSIAAPLLIDSTFLVGTRGVLFGRSVAGVLATFIWSMVTSVLCLLFLLLIGKLRVDPNVECVGADFFHLKEQPIASKSQIDGGLGQTGGGAQNLTSPDGVRQNQNFDNILRAMGITENRTALTNSTERLATASSQLHMIDLAASAPRIVLPQPDNGSALNSIRFELTKLFHRDPRTARIPGPPPPPPLPPLSPTLMTEASKPALYPSPTQSTLLPPRLVLSTDSKYSGTNRTDDVSKLSSSNTQFRLDVDDLRSTLQAQKNRLKQTGSLSGIYQEPEQENTATSEGSVSATNETDTDDLTLTEEIENDESFTDENYDNHDNDNSQASQVTQESGFADSSSQYSSRATLELKVATTDGNKEFTSQEEEEVF